MKKIIVTDPCYLIPNDDWDGLCKMCFKESSDEEILNFTFKVQELLRVISGDKNAIVAETGFGDWENEIDGHSFYADSGLVCVVEDSEKLEKFLAREKITGPGFGMAVLTVNDNAKYTIDTSNKYWSVVKIDDNGKIISSIPPLE